MRSYFLALLDKLSYLLHLVVVAFILFGWIIPQTRLAHLIFIALTLASWRFLGSCPLTDWHWKLKVALGQPRPEGAFIHTLAQRVLGRPLNLARVKRLVEGLTLFLALLSLALNLNDWMAR